MAAPIYQVSPAMGSNLIMVVFAVVVIGGMGSIAGSILTGLGLGLIEGLTKYFYPPLAAISAPLLLSDRRDQPISPHAIRLQPVTRSGTQWRASPQPK